MKRLFTSLFFFSLWTLSLSAQEGSWTHYFASTKARAIAARGNDILVAATGLVHYDTLGNATPYHETNSAIPSNLIYKVAIDASGNWWIYTENLITRYDGAAWESWTRIEIGLSASATITNIKSGPDGKVYVASTLGAAVYGNGSWSTVKTSNSGVPSDNIRDIAFGSDGKVYFATAAGLGIQDGANWTVINGTSTGIANLNVIVSVGVTQAGVIWVAAGSNLSRKFYFFENGVWTELIPANIGLPGAGSGVQVITDQLDRTVLTFFWGVYIFSDGVWTWGGGW